MRTPRYHRRRLKRITAGGILITAAVAAQFFLFTSLAEGLSELPGGSKDMEPAGMESPEGSGVEWAGWVSPVACKGSAPWDTLDTRDVGFDGPSSAVPGASMHDLGHRRAQH